MSSLNNTHIKRCLLLTTDIPCILRYANELLFSSEVRRFLVRQEYMCIPSVSRMFRMCSFPSGKMLIRPPVNNNNNMKYTFTGTFLNMLQLYHAHHPPPATDSGRTARTPLYPPVQVVLHPYSLPPFFSCPG